MALLVPCAATVGCQTSGYTTRVVNGQPMRGRPVNDSAYSEYLTAVMLETQGEWSAAYQAYGRALSHDDESPEIWTRLGTVSCQRGNHEEAKDEFDTALDLDQAYAPAWLALAECELRDGHTDAALKAGVRAVGLDPRSVAATLLVARLLEARGKHAEALAWLRGLAAYVPNNPGAWIALREFAIRNGDLADEERAVRALARLRRDEDGNVEPPLAELDAALAEGDLAGARAVATDLRLQPAYVAVRAGALGKYEMAREQARLVWRADPDNTDAWIVLQVTADALARAGTNARPPIGGPPKRAPSPLAARLFASLLANRLGPQTAAAWIAAVGPLAPPRDPVEVGLEHAWAEPR